MSDAQGSYKLDEAQAVLRETKAIKKAITCGEKEKQDLIKVQDLPVTGAPSPFLPSTFLCQAGLRWAVSMCCQIPEFREETGGSEAWSDLPKVTQPVSVAEPEQKPSGQD